MNTEIETARVEAADVPLSADEAAAWATLVEEGRKLRAPIMARREARRKEINARYGSEVLKGKAKDAMADAPVRCKRWVVMRMAGLSFKKAGVASGATWLELQDARYHNEAFRCAVAAMEENSRQLMKAKAQSVVEQSQDEDAKVSLAQTQVSMRILESLDREHFGRDLPAETVADEVQKQLGNGGFVINLVGDAAKVADTAPAARPAKAVVYAEV